jgi:hypothetical protein
MGNDLEGSIFSLFDDQVLAFATKAVKYPSSGRDFKTAPRQCEVKTLGLH